MRQSIESSMPSLWTKLHQGPSGLKMSSHSCKSMWWTWETSLLNTKCIVPIMDILSRFHTPGMKISETHQTTSGETFYRIRNAEASAKWYRQKIYKRSERGNMEWIFYLTGALRTFMKLWREFTYRTKHHYKKISSSWETSSD